MCPETMQFLYFGNLLRQRDHHETGCTKWLSSHRSSGATLFQADVHRQAWSAWEQSGRARVTHQRLFPRDPFRGSWTMTQKLKQKLLVPLIKATSA